jgi:chromosome segregation ATPase
MPGLSNNNNNNHNHTLHRSNNTSVTNAPPPAMTNPYVQSRSIQTTLTSLTNETQTLREETRRLDSQRLALQERMKQHVQLQQRLDHEIRGAQDQLGACHRQRTMLVQEQSRLETQLGQERRAMQTCATEYEGLLKREKERKIQFCKDITEANKEMGDLLKQQGKSQSLDNHVDE